MASGGSCHVMSCHAMTHGRLGSWVSTRVGSHVAFSPSPPRKKASRTPPQRAQERAHESAPIDRSIVFTSRTAGGSWFLPLLALSMSTTAREKGGCTGGRAEEARGGFDWHHSNARIDGMGGAGGVQPVTLLNVSPRRRLKRGKRKPPWVYSRDIATDTKEGHTRAPDLRGGERGMYMEHECRHPREDGIVRTQRGVFPCPVQYTEVSDTTAFPSHITDQGSRPQQLGVCILTGGDVPALFPVARRLAKKLRGSGLGWATRGD